jgi:outer membrane protein assembly factor BamB
MRLKRLVIALALALTVSSSGTPVTPTASAFSTSWPQFGNNPQHLNNTTDVLVPQGAAANGTGGQFAIAWGHAFYPEHIYPAQQTIINSGVAILGTLEGRVWALNATTGACTWVYPTSCASPYTAAIGPVVNSAAATATTVYIATQAGTVYALNIGTGALVWQTDLHTTGLLDVRTGVSTAVVMDDNAAPAHIYVIQRTGVVSSLNPSTGAVQWQVALGVPTVQTPAYDAGKLIVTSFDGKVRAIDTTAGSPSCCLWTSPQLDGMGAFRQWPVIFGGQVFARTWAASTNEVKCSTCPTFSAVQGIWNNALPSDYSSGTQASVLTSYASNPAGHSVSLSVLNETTGSFSVGNQLVQWNTAANDGGESSPPCIDTVGNNALVPMPMPNESGPFPYTATSGSTTTVVNASANWAVNQWRWGASGPATVTFTSGVDNGVTRTIVDSPSANTASSLTVSSAFPSAPAAGDTFNIVSSAFGVTGWGLVNISTRTATPMDDALHQGFQFADFAGGYGNTDGRVYCTVTGNGVLAIKQEPTDTWQGFYARTAVFSGAVANTWTWIADCQLNSCAGYGPSGLWQIGGFPAGGGQPAAVANNLFYQQSDEQLIARKASCTSAGSPVAGCT